MHLTRGALRPYRVAMNAILSADELEQRATAAGLTVAALCRGAGIRESTWWRWRNGITRPTLAVYERIVEAVVRAEARE